jgi:peptidyl-prolyl cis-trans isomerase B (cyclophilin B)
MERDMPLDVPLEARLREVMAEHGRDWPEQPERMDRLRRAIGVRRRLRLAGAAGLAVLVVAAGTALAVQTRGGGTETPPVTGQTAPAPLDCGVTSRTDGSVKPVGQPDFASAARSGSATMTLRTNLGELTVTMDRARTPCAVASFEHLAANGYLNGTTCHRLTAGVMSILQCGDPTGDGKGGPEYQFKNEYVPAGMYRRGMVAMANAGADTNGSQFFIVYVDSQIPPYYPVVGEVSAGMDIVDQVVAGGQDGAAPDKGQPGGDGRPTIALTLTAVTVT